MDRTKLSNSDVCSFPWLKPLRVSSLGISEVNRLCCRRRCRPGLATTNTEWTWDVSYDTWNLPASQAITVQTCNVLRWSSRWTLWAFSWSSGGRNLETMFQKAYVHYKIFFLFRDVDSPSSGSAVHFLFAVCKNKLQIT
jgi:hypothetical protein